jgi:hypothetical protein
VALTALLGTAVAFAILFSLISFTECERMSVAGYLSTALQPTDLSISLTKNNSFLYLVKSLLFSILLYPEE